MVVANVSAPHQQRIASAQRRRLSVLEVQAAEYGYATPPHIATEIEELRAQLKGQAVEVEPISDEERYRAMMRAVMLLSQQLAAVEVKVERLYVLLPAMVFAFVALTWLVVHL